MSSTQRCPAVFAMTLPCVLASCASFPHPYTAAELHADSVDSAGAGLVHYLGQTGADLGVCTPSSGVLVRFTDDDFEDFLDGLDDGDVAAATWARCAHRLLPGLATADLDMAISRMCDLFVDHADARDDDARRIDVLHALTIVLDARATGTQLPRTLEGRIRARLAEGTGAGARRFAGALLESVEMEHGRLGGRPVTPALLATISDVTMLRRLMRRLPTQEGRQAARARIVDVGLATTSSAWARAHVDEVRERVLRTGRNGLDPSEHPIRDTRYIGDSPRGTVIVEQSVDTQRARLLFHLPNETSVVPALDLRGALLFLVEAVDAPITLCAPAEALDVTPCIEGGAVRVESSVVRMDADGVLHFRDGLGRAELLALAALGPSLAMPLAAGGAPLTEVRWPMHVQRPDAVELGGGTSVDMRVEPLGGRLAVWYAPRGSRPNLVLLEWSDVGAFSITSRGTPGSNGYQGTTGMMGSPGMSGRSASCPYSRGSDGGAGHDGGRGGNGGAGGNGGSGGDFSITVVCAGTCESIVAAARAIARSEGGAGGQGGQGGQGGSGGAGGSGGSGTSCYSYSTHSSSYVSGGSPGRSGMTGPRGMNGSPGASGSPGSIDIQVVAPENAAVP